MGKRNQCTAKPRPDPDRLFPVAIVADRYAGLYSRGAWLAIARADTPFGDIDPDPTRVTFCLEEGPNGTDDEAIAFWMVSPEWIAVGDTPQEAMEKLCASAHP